MVRNNIPIVKPGDPSPTSTGNFKVYSISHFIMTFDIGIITLVLIGIGYLIIGNPSDSNLPEWLVVIPIFLGSMIFSAYFNKDAIKGKSPAKRILGLIIVDNKTGEIANPIKSVIRNITLVFWPIEVIFSLISPNRRIGDFIAGTKVIPDNQTLKTELKIGDIIIALIIGMIVIFLIMILSYGIREFNKIE
ncbi:RDD family protein [Zunongwangia pacifica]|uniref:RDD family protein n=1 Tax=Zunongwangia pacifica TaxID=2911062 RepID=A0A9X2CLX4_9FLAO|nr:RDD family protein [Zunongwangia pacifica]MCL6220516.1 RDD family protein [Zunongwangia pacifica]